MWVGIRVLEAKIAVENALWEELGDTPDSADPESYCSSSRQLVVKLPREWVEHAPECRVYG